MKNNFKLKYFLPSIITLVIMATIYYFNGLYPFGSNPLVQVDADYLYIPALYRIFDFLHGAGSIIYSGTGLGNAIYGSMIIQGSLFSPLNLLLYLVNRDNIVYFFGLFIIIKLCLISLTSYIYIDKKYPKVNYFYQVLFSIIYTFNGFIVLNYFNDIWLDVVIVFPLLVMYLDEILKGNKSKGYIITLALCFIISFYFSFFIIIFILIYSFINLNFDKKDNKKKIFELGKSSVISFLISAFSSIPLLYQIFISDRYNTDNYTDIFSSFNMKSLYLIFTPLLIIMFIKLIIKYKNERSIVKQRTIYKYFILAILYIIPVFIDPINALMHGGSYWSFPYRYGFITSLILIDISLYYISNYVTDKTSKIDFKTIITSSSIIWLSILGFHLNKVHRQNIIKEGILLSISEEVFTNILWMVIVITIMYIIVLLIKNKYFKYGLLAFTTVYSIVLTTSWTIYYASGYFLCTNAIEVNDSLTINHDGRYKVEYATYSPGFGYIFNVDTLDNWIHILPKGISDTYQKLGYNKSGTSIYSNGGTIFTDWLLNFKYILSKEDKTNDDLFTKMPQESYYKSVYKYNYQENPGFVIKKLKDINSMYLFNKFEYQNEVYKNVFDTDNTLINYDIYHTNTDNNSVNYQVEKPSYIYLYTNQYSSIDYITIDDIYIYDFDEYIKYLGYYDHDITINIYYKEGYMADVFIGSIEKEMVNTFKTDVTYEDNIYTVDDAKEGEYLILPINNIAGIKAYNNGKLVPTEKYLDNFIAIKLNDGENNIKIKYNLPFLRISIILTIIGLIIYRLRNKIVPNNLVLDLAYWLFNILVIGIYLYYYFYSLIIYLF